MSMVRHFLKTGMFTLGRAKKRLQKRPKLHLFLLKQTLLPFRPVMVA